MEYFLNQLVNGLCQGSMHALMAIGYFVVVGVVGMVTFTHGEVIMIGAFAAFYMFNAFGNNLLLGIIASFCASWLIGMLVYKVCYEHFFNAPRHISLICTIGISTLIKNLAQIVFGPNQMPMLNIVENSIYEIGPIQISSVQILVLVIVIILAGTLSVVFNRTKWGIALRAVSQDKTAAYMVGINVKRTAMIGNCIGCGLGGVAGMLLSIYYQSLSATMGVTLRYESVCFLCAGWSDRCSFFCNRRRMYRNHREHWNHNFFRKFPRRICIWFPDPGSDYQASGIYI